MIQNTHNAECDTSNQYSRGNTGEKTRIKSRSKEEDNHAHHLQKHFDLSPHICLMWCPAFRQRNARKMMMHSRAMMATARTGLTCENIRTIRQGIIKICLQEDQTSSPGSDHVPGSRKCTVNRVGKRDKYKQRDTEGIVLVI